MNSDQVAAFVSNLDGTLDSGATSLRDASDSVTSFANVIGSSTGVLQQTSDLLSQAGATSAGEGDLVADAKQGLSSMKGALDSAVEAVNGALKDSAGNYDAAGQAIEGRLQHRGRPCGHHGGAAQQRRGRRVAGRGEDARPAGADPRS